MPEGVVAGHRFVGILCGGVLAYQYFMIYPQESKGMFDYWIKEKAEQLKTQEDWQEFLLYFHRQNYHCRYFMVHRLGNDAANRPMISGGSFMHDLAKTRICF